MSYNEENMGRLAKIVVDSWDMKILQQYAIEKLIETYDDFKECFDEDAETFKDELKGVE